jgi:serine/threonine protein phosphatase PrpC
MSHIIGKAIDVGLQRRGKANQDALEVILPGIFSHNPPLLIVADGMGGYTGGALASKIVIRSVSDIYKRTKHPANYCEILRAGIIAAHQEMMTKGKTDSDVEKMGSTIVAVVLEEDMLHLVNVGDSRAYIIREDAINQISYDHSFVGELLRQRLITQAESISHPKRNVLTMSISAQREDIDIYSAQIRLDEKDIVLLCSDGLWGPVSESQIQTVAWELPPQQAADKLIEMANRNQGPDNISVIIARNKANRSLLGDAENVTDNEDTQP